MNERELAKEIRQDLQSAAAGRDRVLYLEGKTDVPILLALLGAEGEREVSNAILYDGVLIRGLRDRGGSGSCAVVQRLDVARRLGYPGIFGVLDGDGEPLAVLAQEFDAPHAGPCFRWKTYCIENLLASTAWPTSWGQEPDWRRTIADFAPYVAINRLGTDLRDRLKPLHLDRFVNPSPGSLHTADDLLRKLREGKHKLAGLDVEAMLAAELKGFHATIERDMGEAHAFVNGKWLVNAFASHHTRLNPELCREEWTRHVRERGGAPEIRDWWRRTIAPA